MSPQDRAEALGMMYNFTELGTCLLPFVYMWEDEVRTQKA